MSADRGGRLDEWRRGSQYVGLDMAPTRLSAEAMLRAFVLDVLVFCSVLLFVHWQLNAALTNGSTAASSLIDVLLEKAALACAAFAPSHVSA